MARKTKRPLKIYATAFWRKNEDLFDEMVHYLHPVSVGLDVYDNRFYVVMHLREGVTSEDIRRATPFALKLHDKLEEWQGKEFTYHAKFFLSLHNKGASYATIAHSCNRLISTSLGECAEWVRQRDAINNTLERHRFIQHSYDVKGPVYSLDKVEGILKTMRFSAQQIEDIIQEGLSNIYQSEPPFIDEYPVSREKVISALRYWEAHIKSEGVAKTRRV